MQHVAPVLEEIAAANVGKLKVVKLNVDENPIESAKARVTSIPTLKIYVKGELVKQIIGAEPKPACSRTSQHPLERCAEHCTARVAGCGRGRAAADLSGLLIGDAQPQATSLPDQPAQHPVRPGRGRCQAVSKGQHSDFAAGRGRSRGKSAREPGRARRLVLVLGETARASRFLTQRLCPRHQS